VGGRGARRFGAILRRGLVVVHRALGERLAARVERDQGAGGAVDCDRLEAGKIELGDRRLDGGDPRQRTARAPRRERLGRVGDDGIVRVDDRRPHARRADVDSKRAGHSDPGSD